MPWVYCWLRKASGPVMLNPTPSLALASAAPTAELASMRDNESSPNCVLPDLSMVKPPLVRALSLIIVNT
jgi:hypothetical protein